MSAPAATRRPRRETRIVADLHGKFGPIPLMCIRQESGLGELNGRRGKN